MERIYRIGMNQNWGSYALKGRYAFSFRLILFILFILSILLRYVFPLRAIHFQRESAIRNRRIRIPKSIDAFFLAMI